MQTGIPAAVMTGRRALPCVCLLFLLFVAIMLLAPPSLPLPLRMDLPALSTAQQAFKHDSVTHVKSKDPAPMEPEPKSASSPLQATRATVIRTPSSVLSTTTMMSHASFPMASIPFNCSSRAREMPMTKQGPFVQYIHVPKTGGTTVQQWLFSKAPTSHQLSNSHYEDLQGPNQISSRSYVFYGHTAIGWDSVFPRNALYILTLREPIQTLVSLYDFMRAKRGVRFHEEVAEAARVAIESGVQEENLLNHHLSTGEATIDYVMGHFSQSDFLIPRRWPPCQLDWDEKVRCALKNLLRVDVVAVTENLAGLVEQLHFHSPQAVRYNESMGHKNLGSSKRQRLSNASITNLAARMTVQADGLLYSFGKRLAAIREERAHEFYLAEQRNSAFSVDSGVCSLQVTAIEYGKYSGAVPDCCRVD